MPKSKQSKHKAPSGDPYSSRKSGDNENTVEAVIEVESLLHYDKCTKEVERLIQCEKCASLHWFCECCNAVAINAIRSISNSPESPLKVLQNYVSDVINQITLLLMLKNSLR